MERCPDERAPVEAGSRADRASQTQRRGGAGARAQRIICAAVCWLTVLAIPATSLAAGGRVKPGILTKRAELDLRLQTNLIDRPRWLRGGDGETDGTAGSVRLFLASPLRQVPVVEGAEARRLPSALGVRELSFPVRKVAAEHLVTRGVVLKLSVGLDRELERGGIGEVTPSVGVLFERRFQ